MKIYRGFHLLNFDIVLGALASSCFAACLFGSSPGWAWWLSLALTVWVLYMGDHILDAFKNRKKPERELHLFIFRNRRNLLWFMGVITVVDLLLIFNFLDNAYMKYAMILAGMVLLFYAMRHVFRKNRIFFIPGEFFVLLLYMAGTWLGPFVSRTQVLQTSDALIALMFAGVLLMNLGVISLYDMHIDSRLGIASMARMLGQKATKYLLMVTGIFIYLLTILQFMVFGMDRYYRFPLILSAMATLLLMVLFMPSYFRRKDYYRLAADAVLFLGFLALIA
jgi:4-hydroxybenzoate polyprenyltransferase